MKNRLTFIWDYDIGEAELSDILAGRLTLGRLDKEWAVTRIMEYASYKEIIRLIGYDGIVEWWPRVRDKIRSHGRKRGFDFLADFLPRKHTDLSAHE